MALGADRRDVLWMILREGLWLTGIGLAIGLVVSFLLGKVLGTMLYEVSPTDPVVFTLAPLVLLLASILAATMPARRATRIAPTVALRSE